MEEVFFFFWKIGNTPFISVFGHMHPQAHLISTLSIVPASDMSLLSKKNVRSYPKRTKRIYASSTV
jgi:hypothetical protein